MSVKAIKLKAGDELLCDMSDDGEIVSNPVGLVPQQSGKMSLVPWLPLSKTREFSVATLDILLVTDAIPELEKSYSEMFSTIVKPDSNIRLISG